MVDPTHSPHGFRFVRASELELRPVSWLARGVVESNTLGVLFGKFGSMKSFAALDLAFSVATGKPFLDHETAQGPVLYIAGEGFGGLARRRAAWEKSRGVCLADAPMFFSTMAANLCDTELLAGVREAVESVAAEVGPPVLIVIDTWSRNLGGDENSSLDSSVAVMALDAIRKPYSAACLVVHHSGWGDPSRTRGSTVLMAAADFAYLCERSGEGGVLKCEKLKDGQAPEPMAFKLEDVPLGLVSEDGQEEHSAVIVPATYVEPDRKPRGAPKDKQEEVLDRLGEYPDGATVAQLARALEPVLFADPTKSREQARAIDRRRKMLSRLQRAGLVVQVGGLFLTSEDHEADRLPGIDDDGYG